MRNSPYEIIVPFRTNATINKLRILSHFGGTRQMVRNPEQTGTVAPSENGRLPPLPGAPSGERPEKFDLPEEVARFGDILNRERPIVEIGPRSVFVNPAVG